MPTEQNIKDGLIKMPVRQWLQTGRFIDNKGNEVDPDHEEAVPLWASRQR